FNRSLGLHGIQYNIGLTCFYTTYVVVETPNNLLGEHFGMGRRLSGCAFGFGICCMCSAFVRKFAEFCFVRALLGASKEGPGIAYFLSKFYRHQELTYSNLGAAFGGLIAPGILKIDQYGFLAAGHHVYTPQLIEGLITTVVAICVFFLVIDSPLQARWLTEEEEILAVGRLESEYPAINEAAQHTRKQTVRQGLLNINASVYSSWIVTDIAVQGAAVFIPTVIATLFPEKTTLEKLLLSVPPYLTAAVVQIITPYISIRMDTRGPFMTAHASVGVIGYAIFVGSKSLHARYAACFLVAAGAFLFDAFSSGLVAVNTGPDTTRAVALGILSSIGYLGGIISTWTYVNADAPDYRKENTLNLAGMVIVLVLTVVTMIYMKCENAQRARGARDHRLDGLTPAEEAQLGHLHPKFK
ncbi:major facilitator superfamily domain-containing protein, partial [Mycena vulgaris]